VLTDSTIEPVPAELDARDALEALFRRHYRSLLGTARLLVDDHGAAEELVQDAFVGLHRRWSDLRDQGAALGYLRSSVVNGARGRLRRRQTAERHLSAVADGEADGSGEGSDDVAVRRAERDAVAAALHQLPRRQRECLVLRYYADLSEVEIAAALSISAGSVKTHAHRALEALSHQLEAIR
jgi:RNA polymerase sigma-70 factor (sigma-E family)